MEATPTPKQTASNNELLRSVKKLMNAKIFKHASAILNLEGVDAARAYLQGFFNCPLDQAFQKLASLYEVR